MVVKEKNAEITLAIFPFEDLADKKGSDRYCKSLYLDLVTELSRFKHFRIFSDQNLLSQDKQAFPYLDYAIKGSFRWQSDVIRINAQLIKTESNHIVWADYFEGHKTSVSVIHENLLTQIAASLQQQVNRDLLNEGRKKNTDTVSAYEYWLLGMDELKKGSVQSDEFARECFLKAIEIDPGYALAYSGMSLSYFNEWSCQMWDKWDVSKKGAFHWAKKAIELDDQNYIAALVLGRAFMYEGDFELSETYIRRALSLNYNDIFCLVQAASFFVFHGYVDEAAALYERVLALNPRNPDNYRHIGAFIALESGDFAKSISQGRGLGVPWVDFDAFLAASFYHAGDMVRMQEYWDAFLLKFKTEIIKDEAVEIKSVIDWLLLVNPYKGTSNFHRFLEFIQGAPLVSSKKNYAISVQVETNSFSRKNDLWEIHFQGSNHVVRELKGFYDLAKLLGAPNKQFHCTELMGGGIFGEREKAFDEKAKIEYKKRLLELRSEMEECDAKDDVAGKSILQREYEALITHLSNSLGLGGKTRKINDPVDKVRSAVTWRIRKAIQKIESEHPTLGKHLSLSVKTGFFCTYTPESDLVWQIDI